MLSIELKVVALGDRAFVTGFVLSGVDGEYVSSPKEALKKVQTLIKDPAVGLIMLSADIAKPIRADIISIRSKAAIPLIYEVPGPRSKRERVEYREILRQILGV